MDTDGADIILTSVLQQLMHMPVLMPTTDGDIIMDTIMVSITGMLQVAEIIIMEIIQGPSCTEKEIPEVLLTG